MGDEDEDDFNRFMPMEFLKRLPGMDELRVQDILKRGKLHGIRTIVDICHADVSVLANVIGPKSAREVKTFLDRKIELKDLKV